MSADLRVVIKGKTAFVNEVGSPRHIAFARLTHDPRPEAQPWEARALNRRFACYDQTPEKAAQRLLGVLQQEGDL